MAETPRRCKKHPKYKAIRKPRVACERCWQLYFGISETCINCGCQENEERGCNMYEDVSPSRDIANG